MKRAIVYMAVLVVCLLLFTAPASAHELQSDGTIAAVMHIEPDDDPIVGKSEAFTLYFKDTTNRFSLAGCHCRIQILQNSRQVFASDLIATSDSVSENPYTFTRAGLYDVVISGSPKETDAFQTFTLRYEAQVSGGAGVAATGGPKKQITLSLALGLVLLQVWLLLGVGYALYRSKRLG